jgi:hypothetical protein
MQIPSSDAFPIGDPGRRQKSGGEHTARGSPKGAQVVGQNLMAGEAQSLEGDRPLAPLP